MASIELLLANLLSPVVLAFALGAIARVIRSDLEFPPPLYDALSIYLLLAIGLKGGAELSVTPLAEFALPAALTLGLGVLTPITAYVVLRRIGRFGTTDAAAVAAHYGSVSAVTFIASTTFAERAGFAPEGFMPALVALLEVPAIVVALMIARVRSQGGGSLMGALHEIVAGRSVVLLLGGLAIGWIAGKEGMTEVGPFFVDGFKGALTLFLLEMGMAAAARLRDLRRVGAFLVGFGIVVPILHGALAIWGASLIGMSVGGAAVLGAMVSSASYIAAPAAVRIALPKANPTLYLTASLGITFPFNLTVGIPLYTALARWLVG